MDKLIIAVGVLLICFALWQTIQRFRGKAKSSCCGTAEAVSVKQVEDTDASHYPYRYCLSIEGMHCSNCAKNVENALNGMQGVWGRVNLGKAQADVLTKQPVAREAFADVLRRRDYVLKGYAVLADGTATG
ncbi:MAG: cation transporter [Oscillospiraceae bacterium]|nr:cation transporter [Oscillospiraceae bacterium]